MLGFIFGALVAVYVGVAYLRKDVSTKAWDWKWPYTMFIDTGRTSD